MGASRRREERERAARGIEAVHGPKLVAIWNSPVKRQALSPVARQSGDGCQRADSTSSDKGPRGRWNLLVGWRPKTTSAVARALCRARASALLLVGSR